MKLKILETKSVNNETVFVASLKENNLSEKTYGNIIYSTFTHNSILHKITSICRWPVNGLIELKAKELYKHE